MKVTCYEVSVYDATGNRVYHNHLYGSHGYTELIKIFYGLDPYLEMLAYGKTMTINCTNKYSIEISKYYVEEAQDGSHLYLWSASPSRKVISD